MPRRLTPEHMDRVDASPAELRSALAYLRGVNRWLGGSRALIGQLEAWSRNERASWPKDRPLTLLDIGTGSADIPVAAVRWARRRGFELRVTAVDMHPVTLDLAREYVAAQGMSGEITLVQADATRLMDLYKVGSFDFTHAALFIHHLPEIPALTVLRIMDRLASRGLVWSDLHRSWFQRAVVPIALLAGDRMVRHDGKVSVEAGFTRAEALEMARRVGVERAEYRRLPLWYRFTLAAHKAM